MGANFAKIAASTEVVKTRNAKRLVVDRTTAEKTELELWKDLQSNEAHQLSLLKIPENTPQYCEECHRIKSLIRNLYVEACEETEE